MDSPLVLPALSCCTATTIAVSVVGLWVLYRVVWLCLAPLRFADDGSRREEKFQQTGDPKYLSYAPTQRRWQHVSGDLPPPYPNGWFRVLWSNELPKGVVKAVEWSGLHVAAWRKSNGQAIVMDGHCPHMGALLGGGEIKDDCVECPFHGWKFNDNGNCTDIPYEKCVPATVADKKLLKVYPVVEFNGAIFAWHHAEGMEPTYNPSVFFTKQQVDKGDVKFHGRFKYQLNTHIQEIAENGADFAHLNHLHSHCIFDLLHMLGFRHSWEAEFFPQSKPNEHVVKIVVDETLNWKGMRIPFADQRAQITQDTLSSVYLQFKTPFGFIHVYHTNMAIQPMVLSVQFSVFADRWVPRFIAKFYLNSIKSQVARDVPIWNLKRFVVAPRVVGNDGPIKQYRKWAQQFYTQSSEEVAEARSKTLDW